MRDGLIQQGEDNIIDLANNKNKRHKSARCNFGYSYDVHGCLWLWGEAEQIRLERKAETGSKRTLNITKECGPHSVSSENISKDCDWRGSDLASVTWPYRHCSSLVLLCLLLLSSLRL